MNEQQWLDWIEENMKKADVHGPLGKYTADIVLATQLSNLISRLPEEKELPVIPQFVVNWIETCKGYKDNLFGVYEFAPEAVSFWIFENESKKERVDLIARAWLDGYTIEKDKLYVIEEVTTKQYLVKDKTKSSGVKWVDGFSTNPAYFTEHEIKAIDERYWAFATEVKR